MRRALLLVALAACQETRKIDLSFGTGTRTPIGFRCRDDSGKFLVGRALDRDRTLRFSLIIDFIGLDGLPTCRPSDIAAFCEAHGCAPLARPQRLCIPLEQALTMTDENAIQAVGTLLRGLDGQLVTDDAPHGPTIVRAVATAQPCADVMDAAGVDPNKLIGCAMSCPVQLGGVDGDVVLDLPTLSDRCADGVTVCASAKLGP